MWSGISRRKCAATSLSAIPIVLIVRDINIYFVVLYSLWARKHFSQFALTHFHLVKPFTPQWLAGTSGLAAVGQQRLFSAELFFALRAQADRCGLLKRMTRAAPHA